ncbi:hypothetical protein N7462_001983 [Penicillium macrosclerotiorum]|uniref:uncharacterized protein n=1 Tax=Penicillium macrosclerotiorum TaxID=303699 RepID=UPI002546E73D|nr:uncharacterized protein N7462_001983 [Penicillium macrosclerotiorum]KAJ5692560.1 hypothetical protein N7462_001983 [Penicillium macrosclerotiorum]
MEFGELVGEKTVRIYSVRCGAFSRCWKLEADLLAAESAGLFIETVEEEAVHVSFAQSHRWW